jgi:hypothetical protein
LRLLLARREFSRKHRLQVALALHALVFSAFICFALLLFKPLSSIDFAGIVSRRDVLASCRPRFSHRPHPDGVKCAGCDLQCIGLNVFAVFTPMLVSLPISGKAAESSMAGSVEGSCCRSCSVCHGPLVRP